ncbi:hypothetical protein PV327_006545 [Microctonus hyperodae]|uniref:Ionotropic receptor 8a n=1 Tax=Microctonus hyperodae TaxID=165561 RepID=A0AA39F4K8_MICHY|nr:hypothetical protein PV327_006545 [Microctonus hyperodae]
MHITWNLTIFVIIILFYDINAQVKIKMVVIIEDSETQNLGPFNDVLLDAERAAGGSEIISVEVKSVELDRDNVDESFQGVCKELFNGVTIILDMTYTGWIKIKNLAANFDIIYLRSMSNNIPFVHTNDDLLQKKNATDVAAIFESERDLNQSLYYLIANSITRLVVIDEFNDLTVAKVRAMRPSPSYYTIFSSTAKMEGYFKTALQGGLVVRNYTWHLIFTDMNYKNFRYIIGPDTLNIPVVILSINPNICCKFLGETSCNCPPDIQIFNKFIERMIYLLVATLRDVHKSGVDLEPKTGKCNEEKKSSMTGPTATIKMFNETLYNNIVADELFDFNLEKSLISYHAVIDIEVLDNGKLTQVANWTARDGIQTAPGAHIQAARRYFRIGTAYARPWSTIKLDPTTGLPMKDENGREIWEGYCIDFIKKLAEKMNFDYDLVIPSDKTFGSKLANGKWTGVVGDLARGETDIAVGALTMTSEREEIIDFVAPYFEQSGILIVMRKPVRKTALFKFMTVLRLEVWLSIIGALTLTAIMIWILDKYSPYSARNNKRIYPYACREFTLKESFWFALTSFTPQGGGEAPKALSSRILVAAYWLFVVLMLATFTANLAAFLTVERMQAQVQSLEQLARQSRINYTVVANSSIHQYFENMNKAEDKLYKVWKEITLNSTSDEVEYRVWDYPIKEQYGRIYLTILSVGPVKNVEEGFRKVVESENAEFAFIHDSSEIKYEITKNCNLTQIGEVFAEQPYAVAVQQGSHLQEEISRTILDLQSNRYFEGLSDKYWNKSANGKCSDADESEGISIESLGGVFIATLFGLALAMITLGFEVIYYRRRNALRGDPKHQEANHVHSGTENKILQRIISKGKLHQLKPSSNIGFNGRNRGLRPRVSHISVYPRIFPFKE